MVALLLSIRAPMRRSPVRLSGHCLRRLTCSGLSANLSCDAETAISEASVESRNQPRSAPTVGIVLVAELCAQQGLFGSNACKERRDNQRREDQAGSRTKGQSPPEHQDDRAEVARVSDDAIDSVSDQFMPRLNGHQPAETTAKDKDWPDAQSATCHIEEDPKPASGIAIKNPQPLSLGVGW